MRRAREIQAFCHEVVYHLESLRSWCPCGPKGMLILGSVSSRTSHMHPRVFGGSLAVPNSRAKSREPKHSPRPQPECVLGRNVAADRSQGTGHPGARFVGVDAMSPARFVMSAPFCSPWKRGTGEHTPQVRNQDRFWRTGDTMHEHRSLQIRRLTT